MKEVQLRKPRVLHKTNIDLTAAVSVICMVTIALIFIFTYAQNLDAPQDSFDEGWRLMAAKLIALGYEPYAEVYHVDPPLYPITTGLVTSLAARLNSEWINSAVPSRAISVLLAVLGSCLLFFIGKRLYGPISGLVAAFMMLLTPAFFDLARRALPEIGAVTMGLLCLTFLLVYLRRGGYTWIFLSGLAFGLSLLFKLIFPLLILLIIVLLGRLTSSRQEKDAFRLPIIPAQFNIVELVWFGVGGLLPLIILLLVLDARAVYEQAWAFHITGRNIGTPINPLGIYVDVIERFLQENMTLVLASLAAVIFAGFRRSWIPVVWLGLGLIMLALQIPVRYRYAVILIPPLALLVGLLAQTTVENFRQPDKRSKMMAVGGILIMSFYLFTLPSIWRTNLQTTKPDDELAQVINRLDALLIETVPDATFLISDEPELVFYVNRLIPPAITELSKKRVLIGFFDAHTLDQLAVKYPDAPILTRTDLSRIDRIPGFEQWILANFLERADIESPARDLTLYYKPMLDSQCTPSQDTSPTIAYGWGYRCLQTDVNGQIKLTSARFRPKAIRAGDPIQVVLNLNVLSSDLDASNTKISIHLVDQHRQIVAQADHVIFQNQLVPVPLNALLADQHSLQTPADLSTGTYEVLVGFYRADTGERLTLNSNLAENNIIDIGDVSVR